MRFRGSDFLPVIPVLAALWSSCWGHPLGVSPTCQEEQDNARAILQRLQRGLQELHRTLLDLGYGGNGVEALACMPGGNQPHNWNTSLDLLAARLCRYDVCFQRFVGTAASLGPSSPLSGPLRTCRDYLSHLRDTITKMGHPSAYNEVLCGQETQAEPSTFWNEMTQGPRLAQDLLGDLRGLSLPLLC